MLFFSLRVNEFTSLLIDSSQVILLIRYAHIKTNVMPKHNILARADKKYANLSL